MESKIIYLLPPSGKLYKTNLHCHSTVSDGKFTPEQLKTMYKTMGYSAIAYTDHRTCAPHTELTDENFVALTGIETAFGIKRNTSIHICGISRDPHKSFDLPDTPDDSISKVNEGIRFLKTNNFITTLNHPRWSGMSFADIAATDEVDNMEIVNGFEMVQDGYGDSSACYELEIKRGRKAFPIATDDSHTSVGKTQPGYEYFQGFTVIKADKLTYEDLINALDSGAFFASTGPMIRNIWLDGTTLHVECSPVNAIYVHGSLYRHRESVVRKNYDITCVEIDLSKNFADSDYIFVQVVDAKGNKAWAPPYWFRDRKKEI